MKSFPLACIVNDFHRLKLPKVLYATPWPTIERFRVTLTANGKSKFVPRDQVE